MTITGFTAMFASEPLLMTMLGFAILCMILWWIDEVISYVIFGLFSALVLTAIYSLVKFVKFAWTN